MSDDGFDAEENLREADADGPTRISKREFIREVAQTAHLPINVTERFYESFIATLLNHVRAGDEVLLTGFGKFYWQRHDGHTVKFGGTRKIEPYPVMRFSSARDLNAFLKLNDEEVEASGIPGTRLMKSRDSKPKDALEEE